MSDKNSGEISGRHYASGEPLQLRWEDGTITGVEPAGRESISDIWLAPALFDAQVNGFGGIDFQQDDLSLEDLLTATRKLRAAGCTRFLLTLITDDWAKMTARLRHLRALRGQSLELQHAIAGWHVEGPFLSSEPGFHGAHNPVLTCNPTPEHLLELRSITRDDPFLLTLSPERAGALPAIELAVSRGMRISLGHTNASVDILARAVQAGATAFTHLGNGCPRDLDRHDNIVWRVLETPGLKISLIPDGIHVSPPLFRLIHRVLPDDSLFYVSDAMSAAAMPPGLFKLGKLDLEVGPDQVVRQPGKSLFAGSALRPVDGVFRAAEMLNRPWPEAWRRFSEIPAALMGINHELAAGCRADICALKVTAENVLVDFKTIHSGLEE